MEHTNTTKSPAPITLNGCRINRHGVKSPSGKYSPAHFSHTVLIDGREAITVYAKNILKGLPAELGAVENGTDIVTDYFESDKCRFFKGTPGFVALLPFAS